MYMYKQSDIYTLINGINSNYFSQLELSYKHFFDIFRYDGTDFTIDHFKVGISLYFSLMSQIYLDNVVSFEYRLCLNDFMWLLYLFLKHPSAVPR